MFQLNKLPSLGKKRKRIGRGGSRGGTSGRGAKGQKARTGAGSKIRAGFEGGQMPLARRLPKRGFSNARFATSYEVINVRDLERCFDNGTEVTHELLVQRGLVRQPGGRPLPVKILGDGALTKSFTVYADAMSTSAKAAIEEQGGRVHLMQER